MLCGEYDLREDFLITFRLQISTARQLMLQLLLLQLLLLMLLLMMMMVSIQSAM